MNPSLPRWRQLLLPLALLFWVGNPFLALAAHAHALAHFVVARRLGLEAEYSIGTGPALWRSWGGRLRLSLFLGAWCRVELERATPRAALATLLSGPLVSGLGATVLPALLFTVAAGLGRSEALPPSASTPVVVEWVEPGSAAEQAGLLPGDVVQELNGAPRSEPAQRYLVGVTRRQEPPEYVVHPVSPGESLSLGARDTARSIEETLEALGRMVGATPAQESLGGPVILSPAPSQPSLLQIRLRLMAQVLVSGNLLLLLYNLLPLPWSDALAALMLIFDHRHARS